MNALKITPHVGMTENGEVFFEFWCGGRKLSVWGGCDTSFDDSPMFALWGERMERELHGESTLDLMEAWEWLCGGRVESLEELMSNTYSSVILPVHKAMRLSRKVGSVRESIPVFWMSYDGETGENCQPDYLAGGWKLETL